MKKITESVFLLRTNQFEDMIPERFNIYAAVFTMIWYLLVMSVLKDYLKFNYIINCIICYLPIIVFFIPNIKYFKHLFSSKSLDFGNSQINTFVFLPFCIIVVNAIVKVMLTSFGLITQNPQNLTTINISVIGQPAFQ